MVAVTPTHTLSVWVDKPDGTPSPGDFGRRTAAPLKAVDSVITRTADASQTANGSDPTGYLFNTGSHCHQQHSVYLIDEDAPATLKETVISGENPRTLMIEKKSG